MKPLKVVNVCRSSFFPDSIFKLTTMQLIQHSIFFVKMWYINHALEIWMSGIRTADDCPLPNHVFTSHRNWLDSADNWHKYGLLVWYAYIKTFTTRSGLITASLPTQKRAVWGNVTTKTSGKGHIPGEFQCLTTRIPAHPPGKVPSIGALDMHG